MKSFFIIRVQVAALVLPALVLVAGGGTDGVGVTPLGVKTKTKS